MSKVRKDQVHLLINLQHTEQETLSIQSSLGKLPDRIAAVELRLDEYIRAVENGKSELEALHKKYRTFESNAKDLLTQVDKSNEKLKAVKTNKEYQSGLKEIDKIKEQHSKLEDEMIVCLDEIEAAENDVVEQQKTLEEMSEELEQDKAKLKQESKQQQHALTTLQKAHQELLSRIDPELLKRYRAVQNNTGSIALAGVKDAVCQVCNVNIPPQMYNELLRADNLLLCPHCQRMIYPANVFAGE